MKRKIGSIFAVLVAVVMLSVTVMELNAHARAGGSRSMGSRGSRSYSRPVSPSTQPSQRQQQAAPAPGPLQQPAGGGFLRSMAGGIMGGMLGSMLFRGLAGAGTGGMGGGGIGLFEIALLAGIGYLIYRFIKNRRTASQPTSPFQNRFQQDGVMSMPAQTESFEPEPEQVRTGISHIRQMDAGFHEAAFNDTVMDIFFKIQAAWMNRDLSKVSVILTDEMRQVLQGDVDQLRRDKQINRLENIAVRKVDLAEVWQESGQDHITALIQANLLDYTTDETGAVVAGSTSEPVKFEEYWTFVRPVGNNPWQLSAIHQK